MPSRFNSSPTLKPKPEDCNPFRWVMRWAKKARNWGKNKNNREKGWMFSRENFLTFIRSKRISFWFGYTHIRTEHSLSSDTFSGNRSFRTSFSTFCKIFPPSLELMTQIFARACCWINYVWNRRRVRIPQKKRERRGWNKDTIVYARESTRTRKTTYLNYAENRNEFKSNQIQVLRYLRKMQNYCSILNNSIPFLAGIWWNGVTNEMRKLETGRNTKRVQNAEFNQSFRQA